jgi:iron-sulfur cluster assembly protein
MITLTKKAANHIATYLNDRGKGIGIRVGVKTTGCSGLMYVVEPVDLPDIDDQVFASEGIDVYVDGKSLVYVTGSELDYVEKGLNAGLEFKNPNVKGECGCGESFNV